MKIFHLKKIISSLLVCALTMFSCSAVYADENDNASAPVSNSANNNNSDSTSNKSQTNNNNQLSKQSQDAISNMLLQSVSLMGIAYKWGGNTPDTGMDCSGFVRYVFKKSLGINLPRTAAEMAKVGKRININDLQPGDLIFFNTKRGSNTHIGIYLGSNKFIQSPRTGENIQISDLSGYWAQHFNGAKRVVQEAPKDNSNQADVEDLSGVRGEALPVAARVASGKRHGRNDHNRRRGKTQQSSIHSAKSSSAKTSKKNNSKKSAVVSKKTTNNKKKKH